MTPLKKKKTSPNSHSPNHPTPPPSMRRGGGGAGRGGGRRLPKSSMAPSAAAERTPSVDPHGFHQRNLDFFSRRDSDVASLCSSRPSSIGTAPSLAAPIANLSDRSSQAAALRVVNAYLAPAVQLRPPLPSARDITAALRHLLDRLQFPHQPATFEDDLLVLLRRLGCPYKLNRSALKAPGTPHSWPPLLSVLYWLTLLARVANDLQVPSSPSASARNEFLLYNIRSYSLFISGEDNDATALDEEYISKARALAEQAVQADQALEKEVADLEAKRTELTSKPSRLEELKAQKEAFTSDVQKFEAVVKSWATKIKEKEDELVNLEKQLEAKVMNGQRTAAENEVLVKKIETQVVNVRDADRMQREMQAVEHDITKAKNGMATLEEKGWELGAAVVSKLEETEALAEQCNQALRRLKPSTDFQIVLNAKGSSPAEILGTSYKTVLKPALKAISDETKRISVSKFDESIEQERHLQRNVKIREEKRNHISVLQTKTDEMDSRLNSLDVEIGNHVARCTSDAKLMKDELGRKEHHLTTVEKEADEFLKDSEQKHQDALKETEEETQLCASELLQHIDSITEFKEFMETTMARMKKDLYEYTDDIASLQTKSQDDGNSGC